MNLLLWLLALPFAADADALGAADYRTRAAADSRLAAAGWYAAAAVLRACDSDSAEAAARGEVLWQRLRRPPSITQLADAAAEALVKADADGIADEKLTPLLLPLCRAVAALPQPTRPNSTCFTDAEAVASWVLRPAHSHTVGGDLRYVINEHRRQRQRVHAWAFDAAREAATAEDATRK